MTVFRLNLSALLGLALVSTLAMSQALSASERLQRYQSLCENNVHCSTYSSDNGVVFVLQRSTRTHNFLCLDDGSCALMMPRGQIRKVDNIEARLSAQ